MSRTRLERRLVAMLRGPSRWPWVSAVPFAAAAVVFAALACETAPAMLEQAEDEAVADVAAAVRVRGVPASAEPLILIDGMIATQEQMDALDPESIARIEVVKGLAAARMLPDDARARNGVITIFLKGAALPSTLPTPVAPEPMAVAPRVPTTIRRSRVPDVVAPMPTPTVTTRIREARSLPDMEAPRIYIDGVRIREARSLPDMEAPRIYIDGVLTSWERTRAFDPDRIQSIEIDKSRRPAEIHVTTKR